MSCFFLFQAHFLGFSNTQALCRFPVRSMDTCVLLRTWYVTRESLEQPAKISCGDMHTRTHTHRGRSSNLKSSAQIETTLTCTQCTHTWWPFHAVKEMSKVEFCCREALGLQIKKESGCCGWPEADSSSSSLYTVNGILILTTYPWVNIRTKTVLWYASQLMSNSFYNLWWCAFFFFFLNDVVVQVGFKLWENETPKKQGWQSAEGGLVDEQMGAWGQNIRIMRF